MSCLRVSAKLRGNLSLPEMNALATRLSAVKTVIGFVRSANKFQCDERTMTYRRSRWRNSGDRLRLLARKRMAEDGK
jgi:hypothetical protein